MRNGIPLVASTFLCFLYRINSTHILFPNIPYQISLKVLIEYLHMQFTLSLFDLISLTSFFLEAHFDNI